MSKRKKTVCISALLYLVALLFFFWGVAAGNYKIFPWKQMAVVYGELHAFFTYTDEPRKSIIEEVSLDVEERRAKYITKGFVLRDHKFKDTGYLLISRYSKSPNRSIIELFSIAEEKVIHTWVPPFNAILAQAPRYAAGKYQPNNNKIDSYRPLNPILLNDGGLIFNVEAGPMVRINTCGDLVWLIDRKFHHSVEMNHLGQVVTPIFIRGNTTLAMKQLMNDGFAILSIDGHIIHEHSVIDILTKNGYRGLVYGVGKVESDRIHLNDAQPILKDSADAKVGDIALSIRNLSTVALFAPESNTIRWLKTGPWYNQHDVNQLEDGRYSVFGNNIIRPERGKAFLAEQGKSEVYIYDPLTDNTTRPFSEIMDKYKIASITEGRLKVLNNGDAFIEESNSSRLIRISDTNVRWEYVNSISSDTVGLVHWSRYIPGNKIDLKWMENLTCN